MPKPVNIFFGSSLSDTATFCQVSTMYTAYKLGNGLVLKMPTKRYLKVESSICASFKCCVVVYLFRPRVTWSRAWTSGESLRHGRRSVEVGWRTLKVVSVTLTSARPSPRSKPCWRDWGWALFYSTFFRLLYHVYAFVVFTVSWEYFTTVVQMVCFISFICFSLC
jgi:hypothetical protein